MHRIIIFILLLSSLAHAQQSAPTSTSAPTSNPTSTPATPEPGPLSLCGNGKQDGLEECDDGNAKDGDGCSRLCMAPGGHESFRNSHPFTGPKLIMLAGAIGLLRYSLLTLVLPRKAGTNELIVGLSASGLVFFVGARIGINRAIKAPESVCRNYKIELGEECDDGNARSGDGCSNKCLKED